MSDDPRLSIAEAAVRAGVKATTWRAWRSRGRPRPPIPPQDGWWEMRRPWWYASTVDAWREQRRQHRLKDS
jgi:hypothetical protein